MSESHSIERVAGAKRFFSTFFGEDFAENAERCLTDLLGEDLADPAEIFRPGVRSNAKKQKRFSSTSTKYFQSGLSPIITKSHKVSFYDDPRDKIPSDLNDNEDGATTMDCCDRCQLMTGTVEGLRALLSDKGYEHYTCDGAKQQSSASGCPFCGLIWRIIPQCKICGEGSLSKDGSIIVRGLITGDVAVDGNPFRSGARLEALKLEIPLDPELNSSQDSHHHELGLVAFQESPVARCVVGRRPSKDLTPELIQGIREWLNDCQDKHESCIRRCFPMLPPRVVDLGDKEDSPIRLHVNQNGTRAQYAALSYCWGGDQPYKTKMCNLNTYTQELDSSVFPKTLSDAIRVCREVNMRYIWIDALCIIQDDPEDKAKQISQMGRIYKDATFTLMAASASSVSEGFLDNTKIDAPKAKLPLHIDEDSFGAVFVRSCYNDPYFFDKEPIFNRAWTLQEMLLSSRILMFDSYQVTLKCGMEDFSPAVHTYFGPESRTNSRTSLEYGILQNFHLEKLAKEYDRNALLGEKDIEGFSAEGYSKQSQIWTSIMAEYSRRDISVIDDRYPALAGVTEELQKIWDDKYVAGFWEHSLVQHLGWVGGVNNEQFGGRKWECRLEGPSWSWMSHPSSISICPVGITDVKVLAYEIDLASTDQPFGKVREGFLALEARTLPLSYLGARIRPNINPSWKRALAVIPEAMEGIALDFPEKGMPEGELKALVLGLTYSNVGEHCLSLLVLHELGGGTYERVGHATLLTAEDKSDRIGNTIIHTSGTLQSTMEILARAKREVVIIE